MKKKSIATLALFVLTMSSYCQTLKSLKVNSIGHDSISFLIDNRISDEQLKSFTQRFFQSNTSLKQEQSSQPEGGNILYSAKFHEKNVWKRIESEPLGDFDYTFFLRRDDSTCILIFEAGSLYNGKDAILAGKEICTLRSTIGKNGSPKLIWSSTIKEVEQVINEQIPLFYSQLKSFESQIVSEMIRKSELLAIEERRREEARLRELARLKIEKQNDSINHIQDSLAQYYYAIISEVYTSEHESYVEVGMISKFNLSSFSPKPILSDEFFSKLKERVYYYKTDKLYLKSNLNDSSQFLMSSAHDLTNLTGKVITITWDYEENSDGNKVKILNYVSDDVASISNSIKPYIGPWSGIFSSAKYNGRWAAFVFQDGEVLGKQYSDRDRYEGELSGKIINGELHLKNSAVGSALKGRINGSLVNGNWNNDKYNISGKFSGKKGIN